MNSNTIQVFGIGSPYGEDAVGWLVVEGLGEFFATQGIDARSLDRPGVGLLQHFGGGSTVVLVDAVAGPLAEGEIGRFTADAVFDLHQPWSSHGIGLSEALAIAAELGTLPKQLEIIGVGVGEAPDLQGIRPRIAAAIAPAQEILRRTIFSLVRRQE